MTTRPSVNSHGVVIAFPTVSCRLYRVERSAFDAGSSWESVGVIAGDGGETELLDENEADLPAAMYRVGLVR